MPNKVSAEKRVRQNERRRARNRTVRSAVRTSVKKVAKAIVEKKVELLDALVTDAQSELARAAKRKIIKKNNLARSQSRLMKAANAAKAAAKA